MKSDECNAGRKDLKRLNTKTMAAFTHHEGVQYKSSQLRVSKNSKWNGKKAQSEAATGGVLEC